MAAFFKFVWMAFTLSPALRITLLISLFLVLQNIKPSMDGYERVYKKHTKILNKAIEVLFLKGIKFIWVHK